MGSMSREKGKRGEREVAAIISDLLGVSASRRVRQHEGDSDILGVPGWSIEVKRCEQAAPADIRRWWAQAVSQALQADGWVLRQTICWHKPNPMPESVRDRCTKAHEYVFLLSKSGRYFFDGEAMKEDAVRGHAGSDFRKGKTAIHQENRISQAERADDGKRNRRSVWTVATRPYKGAHFATFPPALIEPCILAGSRPGDIVLDPFMGSGTTAAVALQHGRQYLGCELNPEYKPLQDQRIAGVLQNQPTPQYDLFAEAA